MYICQCCGGRFTTPALCRESRGEYFGYQAYEEILAALIVAATMNMSLLLFRLSN